jgi:hypothetical protein
LNVFEIKNFLTKLFPGWNQMSSHESCSLSHQAKTAGGWRSLVNNSNLKDPTKRTAHTPQKANRHKGEENRWGPASSVVFEPQTLGDIV